MANSDGRSGLRSDLPFAICYLPFSGGPAMTRDTRVQVIAAVVLAACLGVAGVLAVNMTGMAGAAKLTYTDRAEEGQPVEQTIGIALGAFRGIFVNFLWIRANDMKEAGKFY